MVEAVIFDVDGTLVDSVDLLAASWVEAFAEFGKRVSLKDIRAQMGKGSDQLLPTFLSRDEVDDFGEHLSSWRGDFYARNHLPRVQPFPRVHALFQALERFGVRRALASSGSRDDLEHHQHLCNISELVDVAVSGEEVDRSKPHPDLFRLARQRLGDPDPRRLLIVGDTPFDMIAARRAEIPSVGVLCGGFSPDALLDAGAEALYDDPSAFLDQLDRSPVLAPGAEAHPG